MTSVTHAFCAQRTNGCIANRVGRQSSDVAAVETELREAHGDVGFTAAKRRAQHGGLQQPLESGRSEPQHQLTEGDDRRAHFAFAALTLSTNFRALAVITSNRPLSMAAASSSDDPAATATAPALIQSPGVVRRHTAGRHQLDLRQRRAHVLDVLRTQRRRRKHLDDVGARVVRFENFGGCEAARCGRHAARVARVDDRAPEDRRDHELRAGINHRSRGLGVDDGSGTEQESFRQRRRKAANQLHRARNGHRHLERTHAAGHDRVDDRSQFRRDRGAG